MGNSILKLYYIRDGSWMMETSFKYKEEISL
jgi:hypothetical protein